MADSLDSKLGDSHEKTLGGKGKKNDFIGKYKWWIVGALAVIAVVVFLIVSKGSGQQANQSAGSGANPAIDPATGMPYATEYGLGGGGGFAGSAGIAGQTGAPGQRGARGERGPAGHGGKAPTPWAIAKEVWESNHHGKNPTQHQIWLERVKLFGKMNPDKKHRHVHDRNKEKPPLKKHEMWGQNPPRPHVTGRTQSIESHAGSVKAFSNHVVPVPSMKR